MSLIKITYNEIGFGVERPVSQIYQVSPFGLPSGILESLIDAKGDLIVGTAADTAARFAAGSDGYILTADSTQAAGMKWASLVGTYLTPDFVGQGLINGKIVVSVASNNLTVAIKTLSGGNPSAGDPVYCRIGDTIYTLTSALTGTWNAGTNFFNAGSAELATYTTNFFVYFLYNSNAGALDFGFARVPYAHTFAEFSATSTNETYLAYTNATGPASTDVVTVVGRFSATLSAAASYNWSISGTGSVINRPTWSSDGLLWAPVHTGFSSNPTGQGLYVINYNVITYRYGLAAGTSNATTYTATLPFTLYHSPLRTPCRYTDNGTQSTTAGSVTFSGATATMRTNFTTGAWTNANGKTVEFSTTGYFK